MSKSLVKLKDLLNAIKTSGSCSIIGDRVPLVFTPKSDSLVLNMAHSAVTAYSEEMTAWYPHTGDVAAHIGKISQKGKPVSMYLPSHKGLLIRNRTPMITNQVTTTAMDFFTARLNNVLKKLTLPDTSKSGGYMTTGDLLAFQDLIVAEFPEATVHDIGVVGNSNVYAYHSYLVASPHAAPTPGHFTMILGDGPAANISYGVTRPAGTANVRVLKIPTTLDVSVWCGMVIGAISNDGNANGGWTVCSFALAGMMRGVTVDADSCTVILRGPNTAGENGGSCRSVVPKSRLPDGRYVGSNIMMQPTFNAMSGLLPFKWNVTGVPSGASVSPTVISHSVGLLSLDAAMTERASQISEMSGMTVNAVLREALMNAGWVEVGRDFATNHVVEDVLIEWEPADGPQTSTIVVKSNLTFGRLADKLEMALTPSPEVDGIVGRLRRDASGVLHAVSTPSSLRYPMRDPLYRTAVYATAAEAGEDIRETEMLSSDSDNSESHPVTFGQANANVNKHEKGTTVYYASSSPSQAAARTVSSLFFDLIDGAIVAVDSYGAQLEPDEVYVALSYVSLGSIAISRSARTFVDALPPPPVPPVAYPVYMDKLTIHLFNDAYGAITVEDRSGTAVVTEWSPVFKDGFVVGTELWTPEYWMVWGAGKVQDVKMIASGVMANPQGLGMTINSNPA